MASYEKRLEELGIKLPKVSKPLAAYIPAKKVGDLVFCSGQIPKKEGKLIHIGKVGEEKTIEEGYEAARICALNCLAAVKAGPTASPVSSSSTKHPISRSVPPIPASSPRP